MEEVCRSNQVSEKLRKNEESVYGFYRFGEGI